MTGSLLQRVEAGGFLWLTGIEDTFITAPHPRTGRTLDEYQLTEHYHRWSEDLDLMAELGVPAVRYGVPWHRIQPAPSSWDFSWSDGPVERLASLGIEPVLDLVHYGVPGWLTGAFGHADYEYRVEEYASRVAERYKGSVRSFTPLNEPRITAWYTGKLGLWPPGRRGWPGFLKVLTAIARGIVRTTNALKKAIPDATLVHVDAGDVYEAESADLTGEARFRQDIGFLALDLVTGRVDERHSLYTWLRELSVSENDLRWFGEHRISLDVVGINLYPLFSLKRLKRSGGRTRMTMPYAPASIVERLASDYHERYQRPVMITETASDGSVAKRGAWLEASVTAIRATRAKGIPLCGYTWWPLFALVDWAYRRGSLPAAYYLRQMGLWDLADDGAGGLERARTGLVDRYRELVAGGLGAVGRLPPSARTATQ
jgi:beta-glucosidase